MICCEILLPQENEEHTKSKVLRFDLYRPIRAVHTDTIGYWYVDRPLPSNTIEISISPRENETTRHRLVSSHGRRGVASSSNVRTRCRLVFPCEDEAPPRLSAGERGAASSPYVGTRRRSPARRGDTSSIGLKRQRTKKILYLMRQEILNVLHLLICSIPNAWKCHDRKILQIVLNLSSMQFDSTQKKVIQALDRVAPILYQGVQVWYWAYCLIYTGLCTTNQSNR
ncbi:hypothetical protein BHE74_00024689 [Ensete ventricosum]|nr:hypothetical protein BHE74_00024689 [Ensete ventricosum]